MQRLIVLGLADDGHARDGIQMQDTHLADSAALESDGDDDDDGLELSDMAARSFLESSTVETSR